MGAYLDCNATTPPATDVVDAMHEVLTVSFGNASAAHPIGRAAAERVRLAGQRVGNLLGVSPNRLIWTSGATEALNTAIRAVASPAAVLLTAETEHRAVLDVVEQLEAGGQTVVRLPVDAAGVVTPAALEAALSQVSSGEPVLIVGAANGETGAIANLRALVDVVHQHSGLVVCDATQQVGKLPIDLHMVDFAAASAHKMYGPQGVGVLVVPPSLPAQPLIRGGGQQRGWRSGTLNLPGIVGFGVAAEFVGSDLEEEARRQRRLRSQLLKAITAAVGPVTDNAAAAEHTLPNTLNVRIEGVPADALVAGCPDVALSSGSACTAQTPEPSHVLRAIGFGDEHAEESVRLSLGRMTTDDDVDEAARVIGDAVERIRRLTDGEA